MRGAGGTSGGTGRFIIGLIMLCGGIYLLLNAIQIRHYGLGARLYGFGGYSITSGMIMIPFMFGIGMLFYNARNPLGWLVSGGSLVALIFGVISSIQFTFRAMSAFDLVVILVLAVGGLGILLSSFRSSSSTY